MMSFVCVRDKIKTTDSPSSFFVEVLSFVII